MKKNKNPLILFSPCHFTFEESVGGSEQSWAFEIANRICDNGYEAVVTGFKNLKKDKNYKIVELQAKKKVIDMSPMNSLIFNFLYTLKTLQLSLLRKFHLYHHVLPFKIGTTFNLFCIFSSKKYIVGPIQSPLQINDFDKNSSDMRSGKKITAGLVFVRAVFAFLFFFSALFLKFLSNLTLKKAKAVVVINEYTKNILINGGVDKNKITIIPPGIDTKKFEYIPFENKKSEKIELLVVCYLVRRKSVDLIIKAMGEVIKEKNNIILRIVGDGPQRESLEKMVREFNLQNYIIFEGFVRNDKVQEYYKRAHIFLNMSRSEGFATICLEAMSSGLAIISSKVGGFSDAIKDGENGFLVERGDYLDLSQKILNLSSDVKRISEFGKSARLKAENYYDWDRCIIPKYLHVYNKLITENHES